jgi:hypothetical protein
MTPEERVLSLEEARGLSDPGTAYRGCDRGLYPGSRLVGDGVQVAGGGGVPQAVVSAPPVLEPRDRAVVDEALLRGASVADVIGILSARALADTGIPVPRVPLSLPTGRPPSSRRFDLEDLYFSMPRDLTDVQQRRIDQVEDKRGLVLARQGAYVEFVRKEFNSLVPFVRKQFEPILIPPYVDPYATAEEKYRGMRGAYYRAGWPFIKRDVLDLIAPATFYDSPILTGVHKELALVLKSVELEIKKGKPDLDRWLRAGKFSIGGFVPRLIAGSNELSQHAYGLAIDIDATWNPQVKKGLKSADAMSAFQRATGEKLDVGFSDKASNYVQKIYDRMADISNKLIAWLKKFMSRYEQLHEEMAKVKNDPKQKKKYEELQKELTRDPDLSALDTLIRIYSKETVLTWLAYGILSIPRDVTEAFLRLGHENAARWGGEYEGSKDNMHLELLELADPKSPGRRNGPGRRKAVDGIEDLYSPRVQPTPVNGPP